MFQFYYCVIYNNTPTQHPAVVFINTRGVKRIHTPRTTLRQGEELAKIKKERKKERKQTNNNKKRNSQNVF